MNFMFVLSHLNLILIKIIDAIFLICAAESYRSVLKQRACEKSERYSQHYFTQSWNISLTKIWIACIVTYTIWCSTCNSFVNEYLFVQILLFWGGFVCFFPLVFCDRTDYYCTQVFFYQICFDNFWKCL